MDDYELDIAAWRRAAEMVASGPYEVLYSQPLPDSLCPHCCAGHERIAYRPLRNPGPREILHNIPPALFGDVICQDPREPQ